MCHLVRKEKVMEEKTKKKKNIDEKIETLTEKLKKLEAEKKKILQRKGLVIWTKVKPLFFIDELLIENLSQNKEKQEKLKIEINKILEKLYPEIYKRHKEEKKGDMNEL